MSETRDKITSAKEELLGVLKQSVEFRKEELKDKAKWFIDVVFAGELLIRRPPWYWDCLNCGKEFKKIKEGEVMHHLIRRKCISPANRAAKTLREQAELVLKGADPRLVARSLRYRALEIEEIE